MSHPRRLSKSSGLPFLLALGSCVGSVAGERDASVDCPAGACAGEPGSASTEATDDDSASMASDPAKGDGVASFVPCNPISRWVRDGRSVPARVEAHLRTAEGDQIVLVGPDPRDGAGSVRGFIGRDGRLRESFEPVLDLASSAVVPSWTFSHEAGGRLVSYSVSGAFDEQNEFEGSPQGYAIVDGVESWLERLPRTRLAVAGLDFGCARPDAAGWQLSNDPPRHDPPSSCVEPGWHDFNCFSFPEAALVPNFDTATLSTRLSAEVLTVGNGIPPGGGCRDDVDIRLFYKPDTELSWARFAWQGSEGVLVMSSPGVELPFAMGSVIDIEYFLGEYEETIVVRDPAGQLLLWMGEALSLDTLVATPPELSLAQGPEECAMVPSSCTLASQLGIEFGLGDGVERLTYGSTRQSNGFLLVHGGYELGITEVQGCLDGAAAGVTASVWASAP